MAGSLPPSLKAIGHYVKIANENSARDPAVYYWCLYYAVQTGMKIDKKSPDAVKYLTGLLDTLETVKKQLHEIEAVTNEMVAQAHLEQFALKLFAYADTQDRAGVFNKNVVKAFYTSGHVFDCLSLFGELDENILQNRKYAKWKAAYIHNCLKNGETPVPGPMPDENEGEGGEFEIPGFSNLNVQDARPTEQTHVDPPSNTGGHLPPINQPQGGHMGGGAGATSAPELGAGGGGGKLTAAEYAKAQKLCKYAISSMDYEDTPAAIDNLQQALAILTSK